jgi:hypothetical protein
MRLAFPLGRDRQGSDESITFRLQAGIMKLILLFIVLDFLTLLAYPVVFAHGKLRRILQ